jgi:hypothetical protein
MFAAQMVTSKLMEMQAAKEAERNKKREQRMAERMAAANVQQQAGDKMESGAQQVVEKVAASGGRILEQVEAQEMASEEQLKVIDF